VRVTTPRGFVDAQARLSGVRPGVVFLPFHYGYWDEEAGHEPDGRPRAANELTLTAWDPVSKQPIFKTAAAKLERLRDGDGSAPAPATTASAPVEVS
jgi:anaerobic selenocysteine-containing dehydrogenase